MNVLKSGFQNLWETIVREENIAVTFHVDILKIYRPVTQLYKTSSTYVESKCREAWILKQDRNEPFPTWERYDFIIWSPEMKESLHLWKDLVSTEKEIFSKTTPNFFTTSLVDTRDMTRGLTPIDYWVDNVVKKRDNSVWAQRDTYAVNNKFLGPKYQTGTFPTGADDLDKRTCVVYQMGNTKSSEKKLKRILLKHLRNLQGKDIEIKKFKTWRYFPRYSPGDMEQGVLWRILEMQGRFNMWYIGSSVSFESVKSVVEYNKLIVDNMDQEPF